MEKTTRLFYSSVPAYLRNSAFCLELRTDDESEGFLVPSHCCKLDDTAQSHKDFERLLHVAMYWGLDIIPEGVMDFCRANSACVWETSVMEICTNRDWRYDLLTIFRDCAGSMLESAIDINRVEAVDYLLRYEAKSFDKCSNSVATSTAAKWGNFLLLQQLVVDGFKVDERTTASAAHGGSLECLQYLYEQECPWDARLYVGAARRSNLDCIAFAHRNGCPWDGSATLAAAAGGQHYCLEYLINNRFPVHSEACSAACMGKHLPCLVLLHDHSAPWDANTAAAAASGGCMACVQFLHDNGCPWDKYVTKQAAINGNTEILRYSQDWGCVINGDVVRLAAASRTEGHACIEYTVAELCLYMHEDGSTFGAAFKRGNFDCVVYLLDSGCPYQDYEFTVADPDTSLSQHEWDTRFRKCIEYAVERGWSVNAALLKYVVDDKLPLCEEYLRSENYYDTRST